MFNNLGARFGKKSNIFKNFSLLAIGTVAAKLIGLAFYPVLTRLYTPEEFGIFSVFSSSVMILYPIFTLYYQLTIPLLKDNKEISSILLFTFSNSIILTFIFYFILSQFESSFFSYFDIGLYLNYYYVFSVSLVLMAWNEISYNIATRNKSFLPVTTSKIAQSIVFGVLAYIFFKLNYDELGLLYAFTFQLAISLIILMWNFRDDFIDYVKFLNFKNMVSVLVYYKSYPIYRLPSEIIMKLLIYLPILFFTYRYGKYEAGQVGLSLTLVSAPLSLIGVSIGKAYYAEIANTEDLGKIKKLTNKIFNYLVIFGILPSAILYFYSVEIFEFGFGSDWTLAGKYTSVLAFLSIFKLAVVPLLSIYNYLNKQNILFWINAITLILVFVLLYFSYRFNMSSIDTLFWFSIINILSYLYTYCMINMIISKK
jgi:O-antigen/teichoic acid export membrane protein